MSRPLTCTMPNRDFACHSSVVCVPLFFPPGPALLTALPLQSSHVSRSPLKDYPFFNPSIPIFSRLRLPFSGIQQESQGRMVQSLSPFASVPLCRAARGGGHCEASLGPAIGWGSPSYRVWHFQAYFPCSNARPRALFFAFTPAGQA